MQDVCCMTKVAIDSLVETKHYYTYQDEKRKRFGKISDKFPDLDKILQKQDFFALMENIILNAPKWRRWAEEKSSRSVRCITKKGRETR
ncbi:hypothetical protein B9L19_15005 [Geobacillus thermocatenulatus]|uniref:Uncharacterized protein n=1 Tax=Geobacillus thermocatenulatus TaxID=33938 RepID=A0A226Q368_9BACL|nr:hypothetical protein GT3921_16095 [Geobacillus thermocatenulatus]KLR75446.1 hypothetical protein ABH20_00200 [Geobacillus sp. T6]OXB86791.1 hypothetical protein B9L19_15005 [Geobacillus thermocatenulatus]RAN30172.1 hypothetical protein VC88_03820 [Geobacillus sp. A8]